MAFNSSLTALLASLAASGPQAVYYATDSFFATSFSLVSPEAVEYIYQAESALLDLLALDYIASASEVYYFARQFYEGLTAIDIGALLFESADAFYGESESELSVMSSDDVTSVEAINIFRELIEVVQSYETGKATLVEVISKIIILMDRCKAVDCYGYLKRSRLVMPVPGRAIDSKLHNTIVLAVKLLDIITKSGLFLKGGKDASSARDASQAPTLPGYSVAVAEEQASLTVYIETGDGANAVESSSLNVIV
ncbi:MAG: hypothetical protein ABGW50_01630 [Thermococcus sp.]